MNDKRKSVNDPLPGSAMHPGELLPGESGARETKQIQLASALGIAKNATSEIINGKRNITPGWAVRSEGTPGIKAEFWIKYQEACEIDQVRIRDRESVQRANIS